MLVGLVLPQVAFQSFNITVNSSNSFAHYLAFPKRWHDNTICLIIRCFFMLKYIKIIFFIFKFFFKSVHQNIKKLIFKKKLNFLKTRIQPRFQLL
jgi:hypothetical protein